MKTHTRKLEEAINILNIHHPVKPREIRTTSLLFNLGKLILKIIDLYMEIKLQYLLRNCKEAGFTRTETVRTIDRFVRLDLLT